MLKKPETKLLRSFRSSILPQQMSNPSILLQLRDGYRESWRNRHELGKEFHWTLKPLMSSQEETTDWNTSSHWFIWHARVSDKTLHWFELLTLLVLFLFLFLPLSFLPMDNVNDYCYSMMFGTFFLHEPYATDDYLVQYMCGTRSPGNGCVCEPSQKT